MGPRTSFRKEAALRGVEHSPGDGRGSGGTRSRGGSRCKGRKFHQSREQPELEIRLQSQHQRQTDLGIKEEAPGRNHTCWLGSVQEKIGAKEGEEHRKVVWVRKGALF